MSVLKLQLETNNAWKSNILRRAGGEGGGYYVVVFMWSAAASPIVSEIKNECSWKTMLRFLYCPFDATPGKLVEIAPDVQLVELQQCRHRCE